MPPDHDVKEFAVLGRERVLFDQDLSEGACLLQDPGMQGGDEVIAADEIHLQSQDATEQIAVGAAGKSRGGSHGQLLAGSGWWSNPVDGIRLSEGPADRNRLIELPDN